MALMLVFVSTDRLSLNCFNCERFAASKRLDLVLMCCVVRKWTKQVNACRLNYYNVFEHNAIKMLRDYSLALDIIF